MLRVTMQAAPLRAKAQDMTLLAQRIQDILSAALYDAALDETDRIARATPRSVVRTTTGRRVHMQDQWTVTDHGDDGVSIDNPTLYAGYVGQEPVDAFGSRVAAYHNRALRAELDAAPEHIQATLAATLPRHLSTL